MDGPLLNHFRLAYHTLSDRIRRFQQTRTTNIDVLRRTKDECFQLMASAEQVLLSPYSTFKIDDRIFSRILRYSAQTNMAHFVRASMP
jgi:phosphatidylinositol kinase/protein kinase (PI-3  family)